MPDEIERDIREAERLISQRVRSIIVALQKGQDTSDAESRVREMRAALELLYNQRRLHSARASA
jgi:hypothetical protein